MFVNSVVTTTELSLPSRWSTITEPALPSRCFTSKSLSRLSRDIHLFPI